MTREDEGRGAGEPLGLKHGGIEIEHALGGTLAATPAGEGAVRLLGTLERGTPRQVVSPHGQAQQRSRLLAPASSGVGNWRITTRRVPAGDSSEQPRQHLALELLAGRALEGGEILERQWRRRRTEHGIPERRGRGDAGCQRRRHANACHQRQR
jgi:hypothetical protein